MLCGKLGLVEINVLACIWKTGTFMKYMLFFVLGQHLQNLAGGQDSKVLGDI